MTTRIAVRVHPKARRERVGRRMADGTWRLEVHAAPEGGEANAAVEELVARVLGLKRGGVRVVSGRTSRKKLIEIDGLAESEVESRLERAAEEA